MLLQRGSQTLCGLQAASRPHLNWLFVFVVQVGCFFPHCSWFNCSLFVFSFILRFYFGSPRMHPLKEGVLGILTQKRFWWKACCSSGHPSILLQYFLLICSLFMPLIWCSNLVCISNIFAYEWTTFKLLQIIKYFTSLLHGLRWC